MTAAELLLRRKLVRRSLTDWCQLCGFEPAAHHRLLIENLEAVVDGRIKRLAFFLPPGSAKSTYASILFPPWFLCRRPGSAILSASHSVELAESFGYKARSLVEQHHAQLGYALDERRQAAGRWETTNGGLYFCCGVGTGIAGFRADLGLIDDPVGKKEDADSKNIRDKHWDWYNFDFLPRLKPGASIVLIQTRWHEDDLGGRLLAREGDQWKVVRLPFYAEEDDPLGRKPGDILWPEYFKPELFPTDPRAAQCLFQNNPTPDMGNFFKADTLVEYDAGDLPDNLRYYVSSDHAVSLRQSSDLTCLLPVGVDANGVIWVLPDVWWERASADVVVDAMLALASKYRPLFWWAEAGHITKAIGPYLRRRMLETNVWLNLVEVVSARDKPTRAASIQGRVSQGMVRFPRFAPWWHKARHELLTFPTGRHDDFVDALSGIGRGLDSMTMPAEPKAATSFSLPVEWRPTLGWLKECTRRRERRQRYALMDY